MLTPAVAGLTAVIVVGLFACGWCWIIAGLRAGLTLGWITGDAADAVLLVLRPLRVPPRLPLVEWSPRRPVPWALFDLFALVGIWLGSQLAIAGLLRDTGWIPRGSDLKTLTLDQRQAFIVANVAVSLAILAIGLPLISLRTGAKTRDFGFSLTDVPRDIGRGLIGLVMLAPPVYVLQAILVTVWKPSSHLLVELFKGTPNPVFFIVLFVAAAIVAPLFEELMFRVILQGFLERAFTHRGPLWELLFDRPRGLPLAVAAEPLPESLEPPIAAVLAPSTGGLNPYDSPQDVSEPEFVAEVVDDQQPELRGPAAWLPIGISAIVFALMHWSHGPDWVPLTFLAAGMGYLYQRTHRLVPSLIVHAGLNALSMWMLWVHVFEGVKV